MSPHKVFFFWGGCILLINNYVYKTISISSVFLICQSPQNFLSQTFLSTLLFMLFPLHSKQNQSSAVQEMEEMCLVFVCLWGVCACVCVFHQQYLLLLALCLLTISKMDLTCHYLIICLHYMPCYTEYPEWCSEFPNRQYLSVLSHA